MSLSRLALNHAARPLPAAPRAAGIRPADAGPPAPTPPTPPDPGGKSTGNALKGLTNYIPTEVITLYVSALSLLAKLYPIPKAGATKEQIDQLKSQLRQYSEIAYWGCAAGTALFFLLIFIHGQRSAKQPLPPLPQWPWWPLLGAVVAFLVWGVSVPGNPYADFPLAAFAGLAALFLSSVFTLMDIKPVSNA